MQLLVMAKAPVPGRSKTRLCPPCSPEQAAALAAAALKDTLRAVLDTPAARRILVIEGRPPSWVPPGFEIMIQQGRGLDERLANAFQLAGGPSLLIGMDTPQVNPHLLGLAISRMEQPGVDAVLGLAADGGWWALGLQSPVPSLLLGVPMSASTTGAQQQRRLENHRLGYRRLPVMRDVDSFDDARSVAAMIPGSFFASRFDEVQDTVETLV